MDHWIDSLESRCVAGRAHWAEIACGHATTTKGRSCSFPTIARLSGPPFSAATGASTAGSGLVQDDPYIAHVVCCGA